MIQSIASAPDMATISLMSSYLEQEEIPFVEPGSQSFGLIPGMGGPLYLSVLQKDAESAASILREHGFGKWLLGANPSEVAGLVAQQDWILVSSKDSKKPLAGVVDLLERCESHRPWEVSAELRALGGDDYAISFNKPLSACQFTNIVGHMCSLEGIDRISAWFTGEEGERFQFGPFEHGEVAENQTNMSGVTRSGESVEVFLVETWVCPLTRVVGVYREPSVDLSAPTVSTCTVTADAELGPALRVTHGVDHHWPY